MPALRLYGRKFRIANDDLVYPEIVEGVFRLFWFFCVLGASVYSYSVLKECPIRKYMFGYCKRIIFTRKITRIRFLLGLTPSSLLLFPATGISDRLICLLCEY